MTAKRAPLKPERYTDLVRESLGVAPDGMVPRRYHVEGDELFQEREKARRRVGSKQAWKAERERVRAGFLATLGFMPERKTRLRDAGTVTKRHLTVRKLLFSPFGDHWIPANLYLPNNMDAPMPGVVLPPGHSQIGKGAYGERCAYFARNGYVVLSFDFLGEGERHLGWADGRPILFPGNEHNLLGNRMLLHGANLLGLMISETMGAIDALAAQPEVDSTRIGLTGASGGGTLTFFTAALDPRVKAAVPAASVHSYYDGIRSADSEQTLFDVLRRGVDAPDIAAFLIAPRPLFLIANTADIWPVSSTEYTFREAARFYEKLGSPEGLAMRVWKKGHQYDQDQWPAAVAWFNQWFGGPKRPRFRGAVPAEDILTPDESLISKSGNLYSEGYPNPAKCWFDLLERSRRGRQTKRSGPANRLRQIRKALAAGKPSPPRAIDRSVQGNLLGKRIMFSSEPGILLPAEILMPVRPRGITVLVDEIDRRETPEWQAEVAAGGALAIRPDLRGWGETAIAEKWEDWENLCQNRFAGKRYRLFALTQLVGRNLVLERARDVLAAVAVARYYCPRGPVTLWGRRGGALAAAFAALSGRKIGRLILERFPYAYRDVAGSDIYAAPADGFVHGILADDTDLMELLEYAYRGTLDVRSPLDANLCPRNVG